MSTFQTDFDALSEQKEQLKADGVDAEVILVSCDKNDEQFVEHLGVSSSGQQGVLLSSWSEHDAHLRAGACT